ncbi:MAG: RNA polymerase sigma factor [Gemmatimonadetes bacterium]|nr:RNA polymerase sigma factor [Gemmatimonadota bacterium]
MEAVAREQVPGVLWAIQPANPTSLRANTDIDPAIPLRARSGDMQAFAEIVEFFHARCLRYARYMLGEEEDAEEAVQDTFVRVWDHIEQFRLDARFEPWLFRILANRCRTARERRRRREALVTTGELPAVAAEATEASRDLMEEVEAALEELPSEQREAFLLRHVEDLSYEDMAVITGVRLSALRMRVKRACDALRTRLQQER